MKERNDGGPAFPSQFQNFRGDWARDAGMTVRQYYAAKAMQAWISTYGEQSDWPAGCEDTIAENSFRMADAMLKAEEK